METVSLELAKQLHEAGYVASTDSKVYVVMYDGGPNPMHPMSREDGFKYTNCLHFPAPTFTEIWAALPAVIGRHDLRLETTGDNRYSIASYTYHSNISDYLHYEKHDTPAEAAGRLLLWIIENGHKEG